MFSSCQILWFLMQLIARTACQLSTSPLDFFTLAYVVCAVAIYTAWWHKPYNIERPFVIPLRSSFSSNHAVGQEPHEDTTVWSKHGSFFPNWPDNTEFVELRYSTTFWTFLILFNTLFVCYHLCAWNFPFITSAELLLWRITSMCCVMLPILVLTLRQAWRRFLISTTPTLNSFYVSTVSILCLTYSAMRMFLFFEVFFALRSISPSIYVAIP